MSEVIKTEDQAYITFDSDLVASAAESFKSELTALIAETTCGITINFSNVEMVDSVGIGILIATYNTMKDQDREIKIVSVSEDIYSLFTTMRLNRHFSIEHD